MNPLRYSKILIVDDAKAFRVKIKAILREAQIGTRYYEAGDGKKLFFNMLQINQI